MFLLSRLKRKTFYIGLIVLDKAAPPQHQNLLIKSPQLLLLLQNQMNINLLKNSRWIQPFNNQSKSSIKIYNKKQLVNRCNRKNKRNKKSQDPKTKLIPEIRIKNRKTKHHHQKNNQTSQNNKEKKRLKKSNN